MPDMNSTFPLQLSPVSGDLKKTELKKVAELELREFNDYFINSLGEAPLVNSEIALLRTYLVWKLSQTVL